LAQRFSLGAMIDWAKVERLAASGHLTHNSNRIAPTLAGRLLLDRVLGEISISAAEPKPLESAAA